MIAAAIVFWIISATLVSLILVYGVALNRDTRVDFWGAVRAASSVLIIPAYVAFALAVVCVLIA